MDQHSGLYISNGILREYTGQASDIIIPEEVKGISSAVFKDYHALRSIMLPAGLEEIDSRCFEGCDGLKTVMFPSSLSRIGKYAFAGCSSLVFFRMPAGLSVIGSYAFKDCTSLTSIEMPEGVREIGVGAFAGCSGLRSIRIPGRQTSIKSAFGTHPFMGCDKLKIYAPSGSEAEKFGLDNGMTVINISASEEEKKKEPERPASGSEKKAEASPKKAVSEPAAKPASFSFAAPETDAADTKSGVRDFAAGLKKQREARREEAERARLERRKAAEQKKDAEQKKAAEPKQPAVQKESAVAKPDKTARPSFSRRAAVIVLVLVLAAAAGAAGMYYAKTHPGSSGSSGQSDYTLTLEDYINSNDTAKEQLIDSVEGTDVIISVSDNTLIYTYDLIASNSVTPELAQSDELKESLGETLDSSDEQFTELCAGLEKDTGISGVSVEVLFKYGDEILLTRTYTSEGKQQ